jgi:hypothetical protein
MIWKRRHHHHRCAVGSVYRVQNGGSAAATMLRMARIGVDELYRSHRRRGKPVIVDVRSATDARSSRGRFPERCTPLHAVDHHVKDPLARPRDHPSTARA